MISFPTQYFHHKYIHQKLIPQPIYFSEALSLFVSTHAHVLQWNFPAMHCVTSGTSVYVLPLSVGVSDST